MKKAQLIIERKKEWNARLLPLHIMIDGDFPQSLKGGERYAVELESGYHQLQLKLPGLPEHNFSFDTKDQNITKISIRTFLYKSLLLYVALFLSPIAVMLAILQYPLAALLLGLPGLVLVLWIFYVSFTDRGRKNYFIIEAKKVSR